MSTAPSHRRRRVCLFGTSADPPTGEGGHLGIATHLAAMDFDEVRILPVYRHMFGNKRGKQAPFRVRVEMCQLLFRDVPKVVVSEAERICFERASEGLEETEKATIRIGTADLLDMLTKDEPDADFTLALGADTFIDLASGKWRRTEDVFNLVGRRMIVFRRRESDAGGGNALERDRLLRESIAKWQPDNTQPSIRVVEIPTLSDVSSSAVRRSTNEAELKAMLSRDVFEYLQQNRMYSFSDHSTTENETCEGEGAEARKPESAAGQQRMTKQLPAGAKLAMLGLCSLLVPSASSFSTSSGVRSRTRTFNRQSQLQLRPVNAAHNVNGGLELPQTGIERRSFLQHIAAASAMIVQPPPSRALDVTNASFHSAAYGREEYTNSIVASRDTNISPKEVYDTISSEFLKEVFDAAMKDRGGDYTPRALDVGAGAGVSTEVLYGLGYREIDALDWSGAAWEKYVVDDPAGYCPPGVTFFELDDERYLDKWRERYASSGQSKKAEGRFDVIVFNFAVNEAKATQFAKELLDNQHGRLLAPINTSNDYWLKQTYKVMDSNGSVLWSAVDVGAWSVQFQPDVTQDTCSGIWCAPFNGFQRKR